MTIDQVLNTPLSHRQKWTRHQSGTNHEGESCCTRCGIPFPRMVPMIQTICTQAGHMFVNNGGRFVDIPGAVDCSPTLQQWNAQL